MDALWYAHINEYSVILRLVLAVLLGGAIGLERGIHRHQAGMRTHILVCIGACTAMLTNQYIHETFATSDPARLGAQVISGIGFLGAGLILVTSRNKVKGLTTAAGLWASACIGLAIGIGFYSGAVTAGAIVLIVLGLLPRLETYVYNHTRIMNVYVELESVSMFHDLLDQVRKMGVRLKETNVNRSSAISPNGCTIDFNMIIPKGTSQVHIVEQLSQLDGVLMVQELE